ncbi:hypothetical protein F5Y16DRAFT_399485 [Xylariaceae sp. FL0255]|nr:hypothetical protein F5Y16DRAFT_399485 [Xylariaceae sp. FL0255]
MVRLSLAIFAAALLQTGTAAPVAEDRPTPTIPFPGHHHHHYSHSAYPSHSSHPWWPHTGTHPHHTAPPSPRKDIRAPVGGLPVPPKPTDGDLHHHHHHHSGYPSGHPSGHPSGYPHPSGHPSHSSHPPYPTGRH